ncbi:MAG: MBOAT family O-acyltransferase [Planctomycetota bacterium]|jgi:D-alanyl-lipoteichoic acid acyltransferase DltB (MBOAT superfamily)
MIFHSLDYLIFLAAVFCLYWALSRRMQNVLLLGASYFFYGYVHPWFLYLLLTSTLTDYFCGLGMKRYPSRKRVLLIVSLVVNLGMLGVFKYFNFFIDNMTVILTELGLPTFARTLDIFLPVGISFYTFQTLSYTIDIYRGRFEPRRNFIDFAVFVGFFPQLVAGPIERARRLLPQFEIKRTFHPDTARRGLYLMLWGFFKKLVIADNVAVYCNRVFAIEEPSFLMLWAGVFAFCTQLYADFSAYTDIARGTARLFGIRLTRNFNHPYIARSPIVFWQRWHMSLTTWLRDYVYLSLSRTKGFKRLRPFNMLATFFLCGLWHGASWNFVLWGLYNGAAILIFPFYEGIVKKIFRKPFLVSAVLLGTMFFFLNSHCLLFREQNLSYLIKHLSLDPFANTKVQMFAAWQIFVMVCLYSIPLFLHTAYAGLLKRWQNETHLRSTFVYFVETGSAIIMFLGILVLRSRMGVDFIYFQF